MEFQIYYLNLCTEHCKINTYNYLKDERVSHKNSKLTPFNKGDTFFLTLISHDVFTRFKLFHEI